MNATLAVDAQMTAGPTVSKDGIPIGYRRRSAGRAVVPVHGSNESARSHTQPTLALDDESSAFAQPPRRGLPRFRSRRVR